MNYGVADCLLLSAIVFKELDIFAQRRNILVQKVLKGCFVMYRYFL